MVWALSLLTMKLISHSLTAMFKVLAFGVWLGSVGDKPPSPSSGSTSNTQHMTLALKLFRREQAISKFVWHITSTHSSSCNFATLKGSGLHERLNSLHPDHG